MGGFILALLQKRRKDGMKYEVQTKFVFNWVFAIEAETEDQVRDII